MVAIGLFIVWEAHAQHPMLDLRLFKDRRFAVASGGITLTFFAMFGTFYMLTQYLQFVLDYSPLEAAVRLLPVSIVIMAVAPQTPKLVGRYGANKVASTGLGLVALALALTATFDAEHSVLVPPRLHHPARRGHGDDDGADDHPTDDRGAA